MIRAVLLAFVPPLLFAAAVQAQPDYYLDVPSGWSESYEARVAYMLLESYPPDEAAGVAVFMTPKRDQTPDAALYAKLYDAFLRSSKEFTGVRLLRETVGRMRTGEMKIVREYRANFEGYAFHLLTLFCGREGHMFLVGGVYSTEYGRDYERDVKDSLRSFGFAD